MVALAALVLFVATSCKKDDKEKPVGFGIHGTWSPSTGVGGTTFEFGAVPNLTYTATTGNTVEKGEYTYNPTTDVLVLTPELDGAKAETYTVKWTNDKYNAFTLSGEKYKGVTFNRK